VATALELEQHLERRVIGQRHALASVSERIRISRASLDDPGRPVGVFMLVGPSGVGKTETALALLVGDRGALQKKDRVAFTHSRRDWA
jgi:type VI secretion system protein VasG